MKKLSFLLSILFIPVLLSAQFQFSKEQWEEDLTFVVDKLKANHPHIYYRITESEFRNVINTARSEIKNSQSDWDCFYEIKRVVASIQDGHTQVFDTGTLGIDNLRFPFRVDKFSDGVFITVIRKDYQKYLGSKILRIDGNPIAHVLELTTAVTNADNIFGTIRPSVQDITFAKTMYGLGITSSEKRIELELVTKHGEMETISLESFVDHNPPLWSNRITAGPTTGDYVSPINILGNQTPLHLKHIGDKPMYYWFDHMKEDSAIYFQYNQVWLTQPNSEEDWNSFQKRFWNYIDEHDSEIDKLIIDVRYNDGGTGFRNLPLLVNGIIARDKFRRGENLFVLTSNRTYSAAVILLERLAWQTDAIFVGTPPGCPFNFFSSMRVLWNLPNAGIALGIASRQIDNAWSSQTEYFMPDIPTPFSSKHYFSGFDPALDAILKGSELKTVENFAADNGAIAALQYYHLLKEKYAGIHWWTSLDSGVLVNSINALGYSLTRQGETDRAFEVFKFNTLIFPEVFNVWDSFAEWYYNEKKFDQALKSYNKCLELDPQNENARLMIKKILQ